MKDFPETKVARLRENSVGNSASDNYWREREARLSELTSNRLNEMKSSKMNESYSKNTSLSKGQDYQKPLITSPTRIPSSYR